MNHLQTSEFRECCDKSPVLIMVYCDDSVMKICKPHSNNDGYMIGVKRIFDYATGDEVS